MKLFSQVAVPLCISTINIWIIQLLGLLPNTSYHQLLILIFSHFIWYVMVPYCAFSLLFLMTNDNEHLFIYILYIHVFFIYFWWCVCLNLTHFLLGCFLIEFWEGICTYMCTYICTSYLINGHEKTVIS